MTWQLPVTVYLHIKIQISHVKAQIRKDSTKGLISIKYPKLHDAHITKSEKPPVKDSLLLVLFERADVSPGRFFNNTGEHICSPFLYFL